MPGDAATQAAKTAAELRQCLGARPKPTLLANKDLNRIELDPPPSQGDNQAHLRTASMSRRQAEPRVRRG